jgi:hypothetical protein
MPAPAADDGDAKRTAPRPDEVIRPDGGAPANAPVDAGTSAKGSAPVATAADAGKPTVAAPR